jgi:hypothetical protein
MEFDNYKSISSEIDEMIKIREDYSSIKAKYESARKLAGVFEEKLKAQEIKSSEDMAKLKEEMLLNEDYILSLKAESDNKDKLIADFKDKNKEVNKCCFFSSFLFCFLKTCQKKS